MKYIIFGAGKNGYAIADIFPKEWFLCFIDNDYQKTGGGLALASHSIC